MLIISIFALLISPVKKLISILLLFVFWISSIGYFHVFRLMQSEIRHSIKSQLEQGVPEKDLVRISFQGTEKPDWVREGKEFRHQGRMYDIVRSGCEDGKTVFYCIDDRKESLLVARMEKLLRESNGDDKSPSSTTSQILISFFPILFCQDSMAVCHPVLTSKHLISCYLKHVLVGYPPHLVIPPLKG
jgi:hypothetical protein